MSGDPQPISRSTAPLLAITVPLAKMREGYVTPDRRATPVTTWHNDARQTAFVVKGNKVSETAFKPDALVTARVFVSQILVEAPANARAVVTSRPSW